MILITDGNVTNTPLQTYYVESDAEVNDIPADVYPGTVVEINEPGNFHAKMKLSDGAWNDL